MGPTEAPAGIEAKTPRARKRAQDAESRAAELPSHLRFLSPASVALALGLSRRAVTVLLTSGMLESAKFGRARRVSVEALERLVASKKRAN